MKRYQVLPHLGFKYIDMQLEKTILFLTGIFILTSSCMVALSQSINSEYAYNISGSLQRQVFFKDEIFYKTTNNFEVQVRGSQVRIHTWNVPSYGVVQIKDFEFVTDGKESCFITAFDVDPQSVEKSQKPGANKMGSSGMFW